MLPSTLVVLGASNVSRGFPSLVTAACRLWHEPGQLFVAKGHGRSYGLTSRLLGRTLPGICQSGLLEAVRAAPRGACSALVTDVGNDLPYGVPVEKIAAWVTEVFDRLSECGARVAVLPLPIASLRRLPRWKYVAFLRLLYPACKTSHHSMLAQADALNASICSAAAQRKIQVLEHDPGWYGFDPIHIRRRHVDAAWGRLLQATLDSAGGPGRERVSAAPRRRLQRLRPHRFGLFGREFHTAQPSGCLADGTRIHLY
jgi:hypothetical protein